MVRRRPANTPYWLQPCARAKPSETARTSARSRDEEAEEQTPEQTLSTNPQSTSPLFKVPREIRDYIYKFALITYEDPARPCSLETRVPDGFQRSFPRRPGHYPHLRTDTALLCTCHLVHDETSLLPVSINTHNLCYPDLLFPPQSYPMPTTATRYFKRMTSVQLAAVQHIHVFTHLCRLGAHDPGEYHSFTALAELGILRGEKGVKNVGQKVTPGIEGPYPKKMTITIRNCDWKFERENRAKFFLDHMLSNRHWENVFGELKELRIELEIFDQEREELVPTINILKQFEFDIGGGESLVPEETVEETLWMAPLREDEGKKMKHHVAALVWKVKPLKVRPHELEFPIPDCEAYLCLIKPPKEPRNK